MTRIAIRKTYKLFIGGKFPRTESGRSHEVCGPKGAVLAQICRASRKDLRDAVVAAEAAGAGWTKATPYLRGQIVYRAAEMLETRKPAFVEELRAQTGVTDKAATQEVDAAIDRLVWYAGWADKYVQCAGSVNPVASPYFNFSIPEPMGVIGIVAPDAPGLLGLVSTLAPAIVSGNTVVVIASEKTPLTAISFAEVLATSDLPGGVVNILTGTRAELLPTMAKHMAVAAIDAAGADAAALTLLQREAPANLKRVVTHTPSTPAAWLDDATGQGLQWITQLTELKTAWHPIGV